MIKKIILIGISIVMLAASVSFAETESIGIGMSVPVFVMHMKIASKKVKWSFSSETLDDGMVRTGDGHYVVEYDDNILLYINTMPETKMIKNIALSFSVDDAATPHGFAHRRGHRGEEFFESLCQQIIMALNPQIDHEEVRKMLRRLGLNGAVLDGHQRCERHGGITFITKLQHDSTIVLAAAGI